MIRSRVLSCLFILFYCQYECFGTFLLKTNTFILSINKNNNKLENREIFVSRVMLLFTQSYTSSPVDKQLKKSEQKQAVLS